MSNPFNALNPRQLINHAALFLLRKKGLPTRCKGPNTDKMQEY
jgi:hypothetical protein